MFHNDRRPPYHFHRPQKGQQVADATAHGLAVTIQMLIMRGGAIT